MTSTTQASAIASATTMTTVSQPGRTAIRSSSVRDVVSASTATPISSASAREKITTAARRRPATQCASPGTTADAQVSAIERTGGRPADLLEGCACICATPPFPGPAAQTNVPGRPAR